MIMTEELKTLKDINVSDGDDEKFVERYDLKQEAIKWVRKEEYIGNDRGDAIANWIKHFFNLTDEDVMEEERNANPKMV